MKTIFKIAFVASLILNAFSFYKSVDCHDMAGDLDNENQYRRQQLSTLTTMVPLLLPKTSHAELLDKAKKSEIEFFEKGDNEVVVGGVRFILDKGVVTSITTN